MKLRASPNGGNPTTNHKGDDNYCGELKKAFKEKFPTVCLITDSVKNYTYKEWGKVKEYDLLKGVRHSVEIKRTPNAFQSSKSVLPLLLQLVETDIFLDKLLKEVRLERYKAISKHDSIVVKESCYEEVKTLMNAKINETFLEDRYAFK